MMLLAFLDPRRILSMPLFWSPLCNSHTYFLDPSSQSLNRHEKVITTPLMLPHLPTTTTSYEGHTNAKVHRVYKYPTHVTISKQARFWLNSKTDIFLVASIFKSVFYRAPYIFVKISNHGRLGLRVNSDLNIVICIFFFGSVFNSNTNTLEFLSGIMASSPRAVLDAAFQCEVIPICLEERSSSSLVQALNRTLTGRLLTAKRPSVINLTLAVSRLWNCTHRLRCFDHGKCLYSFEFTFAPDVVKVVSGGPWYVNGDLLLIIRMNPNQSIEQLPFSFTKLWVRCYDLPPKFFTKDYAEAICNSLGRFCDTDLPSEDPDEAKLLVQTIPTVRKYLRVKFEFNLYGPLKSTQSIKICNAKKVVVEEHISRLTYERLPHSCFRCGFVGHLVADCSFTGPLLYGEWIRAEKFFKINLQNAAIPSSISTNKEGQSSTSQRIENQAIQITNVADLVTSIVNDPSIIKASFSLDRAEGLPPSKGKSPMVSTQHMVPYTNASPAKSLSPTTVFGPPPDSIMGSVPSFLRSHGSPLSNDTILIESDEGQFASFLNSIASHEDGLTTNTSRCLFHMEQSLPAISTGIKVLAASPNTLEAAAHQSEASSGLLSKVFNDEIRKLPVGCKRAQGNPQTPRPKRGRQPPGSDGQV